MKFFTHLTVILLIFLLPDLMFRASSRHKSAGDLWMWLIYGKTALYLALFYINYYVLIPRMLYYRRQRRLFGFISINLALVVGLTMLMLLVQFWVFWGDDVARHGLRFVLLRRGSFFFRELGMMILTIGLSVALRLGEKWSNLEQHHQQLLASQKSEELQNLKNQLNPHFLFNTLNTIYALIAISPSRAQNAVHQLSAMLRYMLYENPATVPLSREVDFLKNYLALMQERLPAESVNADFHIGPDPEVAPLLFIPLIENALKYGNTSQKGKPIIISIEAKDDGTIVCATSNHFTRRQGDERASGIGLANLRRRLQLLYAENATLEAGADGDVFNAVLTIKPF